MDLADREPGQSSRRLQHDADSLPEGRCARPGSKPSTVTSPASRSPVALQDLDGRRLAGSVRAQQAEDLARSDLEVDSTNRLDAVVRLPKASDRDRASRKLDLGERGRSEVAVAGAECECDLRAVRLVADHDDRGACAFDGCEDVLGRGSRCEPFVDPQLDAGRFRDRGSGLAGAQERAREDGLGRDSASSSPSSRACSLPRALSGRSESGSPGSECA